jgi:hydrogenase maturation protease
MNVSVSSRPLILGIGNPLRGDDGLGRVVAEQLAQASDLECSIQVVHQLTPELAQDMAAARLVVMIDATRAGEPGDVRIRSLSSPAQQPGAVGTHHTTPEELVGLTRAVYGHCPPVVVMTVTGADFSMGEQISPVVEQKIALASTAVRQICASFPTRLL